ncbi:protein of unknown function [[Clostridium] ultunense Esp]|uniref:Uncharacterized protein n=1 Tax=[Clostridium] ultunense Esp TaxID=1288971 RepID=A0A1M4PPZ5_9FIRM|nr:protein of unknown function [[Clostridium] ultunense Esp]
MNKKYKYKSNGNIDENLPLSKVVLDIDGERLALKKLFQKNIG